MIIGLIICILLIIILYLLGFLDIIDILFILILNSILNFEKKDNVIKGGKENMKLHIPKVDLKLIESNKYMDEYVKNIFRKKVTPDISHYPIDIEDKYYNNLSRILLDDEKKYQRRFLQWKPQLHWGQLKLMLSEIEFLNEVLKEYYSDIKNNKDKKIYFIYAGAAPGHHIEYLSKMFPMIYFELYDPNNFIVKESDKIKIHQDFFTNKIADEWQEKKNIFLVFCSDIRREPATVENVKKDMDMQFEFWKHMKPDLSIFKFRLPWYEGKTEYPEGKIFLQAFPGPNSTETRLLVKKNAKIIEYDNTQYENRCYYHNTVNRSKKYNCVLGKDLDILKDGIDNCYDCVSFVHIAEDYLKLKDKIDNKEYKLDKTRIKKMIRDIQNEITKKGNIYTHTIKNINDLLGYYVNNLNTIEHNKINETKNRYKFKSKAQDDIVEEIYKDSK